MKLIFDIETDDLDATKVWCIVAKELDGKSYRFTPDEIEDSERSLNCPISEVLPTCVPPHSSKENLSSMLTTLTLSPYFSPKRAVAPFFLASSMLTLFSILTLIFSKILVLTISLIFSKESTSILEKCEKSNLYILSVSYTHLRAHET